MPARSASRSPRPVLGYARQGPRAGCRSAARPRRRRRGCGSACGRLAPSAQGAARWRSSWTVGQANGPGSGATSNAVAEAALSGRFRRRMNAGSGARRRGAGIRIRITGRRWGWNRRGWHSRELSRFSQIRERPEAGHDRRCAEQDKAAQDDCQAPAYVQAPEQHEHPDPGDRGDRDGRGHCAEHRCLQPLNGVDQDAGARGVREGAGRHAVSLTRKVRFGTASDERRPRDRPGK